MRAAERWRAQSHATSAPSTNPSPIQSVVTT